MKTPQVEQSLDRKVYISIDIQNSMAIQQSLQHKKQESYLTRSPTLDTVLMVEKKIEETSGEYNRTELWKSLPKKVMWQTFLVILGYLESINKIAIDKEGKIGWIWDPEGVKKYLNRKDLSWN